MNDALLAVGLELAIGDEVDDVVGVVSQNSFGDNVGEAIGLAVDDEVDEVTVVVVTILDSVDDDVGLTGSLAVGDEVVETVIGEAVRGQFSW